MLSPNPVHDAHFLVNIDLAFTLPLRCLTSTTMLHPVTYHPRNKIRLVTAASLFDGHDAAINIMRRIMQASGAEI
ncbi:MAG: hypothetical protein LH618_04855, partial [Saprospiraceae bacterium]|nr:hypothetical protein [Saprospiraceae bacterium]